MKGLGEAKYAQLQAVLELTRRALREELSVRNALNSPRAVQEYLRLTLAALPNEVFYVLFLDAQHRLIAGEELFRGTLTQTSVYPREVVKQALHHNSAAVIFAHNHPSGVAEAVARRRTADAGAEVGAGSGRHQGAGSSGHRRERRVVVCREGPALKHSGMPDLRL